MICNSQYFGSCCCLIIRWYFSVAGTICQNSSFQAICVCDGVLNQGDSCVDFGYAGAFPGKTSCCETAPVKTSGKFGYLPHGMQLSHSCLIIRWYFSVAGLFCDTSTRRLDRNPNPIAPPTGICVAAPTKSRKSSFIKKVYYNLHAWILLFPYAAFQLFFMHYISHQRPNNFRAHRRT